MAIALDTLVYAKRLREAGFSEQQAEGQARALAAAMTDSLATKQDLQGLEARSDSRFAWIDVRFAQIDARFEQVDARFAHLERQMDLRFAEQTARFDARLADLERRMTMRLGGLVVGSFGVFSAIVKLL